MKSKSIYRLNWTVPTTLLLIISLVGCGGPISPPTQPPASPPAGETPSTPETAPTSEPSLPSPEPGGSTPTSPPEGSNVKFQDNFSDPSTGWADATLGHYHVGYHEPE